MKPAPTKNATHAFNKPANWDDAKDGECGILSVRVQKYGERELQECISTWRPSPEEITMLAKGGVVILSVIGNQPPVALWVEETETPVAKIQPRAFVLPEPDQRKGGEPDNDCEQEEGA